jgi:4'-phosphopantetheinyl transferase EntD
MLKAAEAPLVTQALPARRSEFATGRWCARHALGQVGAPADVPLLADERGAPRWPLGFVGSISHTAGWTGAVAARAGWWRGIRSVGLDAESAAPLPPGVLDVVASRRERSDLERLESSDAATPWDTVVFTAKEATYKAWYPLTGLLLSHDDVEVRLLEGRRFAAEVRACAAPGARRALHVRGRWALGPRVVVSLAVVD